MIVVNLCGAPGSGKSTGAAYVFSRLKMLGINAELVTEFAKDKVWEESHAVFENQLYMLAKQYFRITRCENKGDVIVTDSPILLSLIYNKDRDRLGKDFDNLVIHLFNHYNNMNYFLHRVKPYNPKGRFQTEEESDELSKTIKKVFTDAGCKMTEINGDILGYDLIVSEVLLAYFKNDPKLQNNNLNNDVNNNIVNNNIGNTESSNNGWISIDDQRPDSENQFLVYTSKESILNAQYLPTTGDWMKNGVWIGDIVRYWKPLPKLPEKK